MTGIDKAIEAAGTQRALARELGVTQQAISKMKRRGWAYKPQARRIAARYPEISLDELVNPADVL